MSDNIWHISAGSEPNIAQRNKLNGSDLYDIRCIFEKLMHQTQFFFALLFLLTSAFTHAGDLSTNADTKQNTIMANANASDRSIVVELFNFDETTKTGVTLHTYLNIQLDEAFNEENEPNDQ
ncbi:MAG TPA: hypothetical protein VEL47_01100 [Myxococcota bacterium]|nr:hypothetical protein [Myxococcota bacterium]